VATNHQDDNLLPVHSALFVDFDNIYITLAQQDSQAAQQFAANPDRWLAWLEQRLPVTWLQNRAWRRRILVRRCYLNPQSFAAFRPYFIRSAFEVIDCPPLTRQGKTSTDIHLVMDILDALDYPTRFDEFIILSGDADFTPVLLRLRKHDRYSAVLSVGYVSPAYKASCDYLIPQDTFVKDALGISYQEEEAGAQVRGNDVSRASAAVLSKMAARLYDAAALADGIEASDLPAVYKEFAEFRQGNRWLGFLSLRNLTQAIVTQRDTLMIVDEDPWRVVRAHPSAAVEEVPVASKEQSETPPKESRLEELTRLYPDLAPLAWKVHQLTDTPFLLPDHYAVLLQQLARTVNEQGYQMSQTAKTVRDRCVERGAPVARSHVNFVLIGIGYGGHYLGQDLPEDPINLGDVLVQNTINLCHSAQFHPSEAEAAQIRTWIMGALQ
jgi:NYN domain